MLTLNQQQAFEKFKRLKVGALFMKQGTGKTRVAIELIKTTDSDLVLFFCPFSTKENLKAEIDKWELDREYLIIGYETISNSDKIYIDLLKKINNRNIFIVADESIFLKNDNTIRYRRLMNISENSEYKLILNGTPISKNEWDIYNQMNFLSPEIIGMSKNEFLNVFFKKIKYKKVGEKAREFYKISEINIDYLHKLIAPYVFECDFEFEKKEKTKKIVIPASVEAERVYNLKKQRLLESLANGKSSVKHFSNLAMACFKDQGRYEEIAKNIKEKTLIFSTFVEEAKEVAKHLNCHLITGETTLEERNNILNEFEKDNKALVMTFGTGAYGLNLQFCNKIAFTSITFDYAKTDQAISRIKRIGQERDVEYTYFTSNLKIYNMIFENNQKKQDLKELLIDKIKNNNAFEHFSKKL